MCNKGMKLPN